VELAIGDEHNLCGEGLGHFLGQISFENKRNELYLERKGLGSSLNSKIYVTGCLFSLLLGFASAKQG